jgi:hypothetical protein
MYRSSHSSLSWSGMIQSAAESELSLSRSQARRVRLFAFSSLAVSPPLSTRPAANTLPSFSLPLPFYLSPCVFSPHPFSPSHLRSTHLLGKAIPFVILLAPLSTIPLPRGLHCRNLSMIWQERSVTKDLSLLVLS